MKKRLFAFGILVIIFSCKKKEVPVIFELYDETSELAKQQNHEKDRMQFKLIQSKYLDMNTVFKPFEEDLAYFSESDYLNLEPYILEKDIPSIQTSVGNGILSYKKIVQYYLYRIRKFENNQETALHSIITLNPNILTEAEEKDKKRSKDLNINSLYGLPILLKDNINTVGMPTTAGAFALKDNAKTEDAFIVQRIKEQGGIILGKANLSEWAYYFCSGCPLGYSAIGGQTLNPYGRKVFETGGSSSGSGVSMAANYAVVAVGTETSGSILSPSSKNSVVGLKPTVGLLSRTGIVPISSTLDTPGPMTRTVIDNAIFLNAMLGKDSLDEATNHNNPISDYVEGLTTSTLKDKRFGALKSLLNDSIYALSIEKIRDAGAVVIEIDPERLDFKGFRTLLNIDMRNDLPKYLNDHSDKSIEVASVKDIVDMNLLDTLKRAPYGQELFEGIVGDSTSVEAFKQIKQRLHKEGIAFFKPVIDEYQLDAVLSINNYHAGIAAVAKYPCLTVPMGYTEKGEPISLTFVSRPFTEKKLLQLGYAFEQLTKVRKLPAGYW